MKKKLYRYLSAALCACMLLTASAGLAGCAVQISATDLMEGISPSEEVHTASVSAEDSKKAAAFALKLLRECYSGGNILLSPLSVTAALGMTANGASGQTKTQMEEALGMSVDELNAYMRNYSPSVLPSAEKCKFSMANSIWLRSGGIEVKKDFLQKNADYYGADAYSAPFDDSTLKDINGWVKDNTDGMIPSILKDIPRDAVMYLVNALAFEAEWEEIYKNNKVRDGVFTTADGKEQTAEFMYSDEYAYIEGKNATGFLKYYSGHRFAFAALLPQSGMTVGEFLNSLGADELHTLISSPENTKVRAGIPKFETEYDTTLNDALKKMGMADAFGGSADFSGMSDRDSLFISNVIHKTYIRVDERGTRAGAATAVEMTRNAEMVEQFKTVTLDRPFVYMLVDTVTGVPFFIGVTESLG